MSKYTRIENLRKAELLDNVESSVKWASEYCDKRNKTALEKYATVKKAEAYLAGKMTKQDFLAFVRTRKEKKAQKDFDAFIMDLENIENAPDVDKIKIAVDWKKSATWGMNPHVEISTVDGVFNGFASGCGYDKLSSATASAFNQSSAVLKLLYEAKEKALAENGNDKEKAFASVGYGSGASTIVQPFFEGGVGVSCYRSIFENLGYTWEHVADGKYFDAFYVTKK